MTYTPPPDAGAALRLHLNENTAGCSPAVLAAIQSMSREDASFYPDYAGVTATAERWFNVPAEWVQLTNGLDEGLHVTALAAARGRLDAEAIIVEPAFEMYEACADAAGLSTIHVPPPADLGFPLDEVLGAVTSRTRLINLTDPNNPTGLGISADAIPAIAQASLDSLVLVDEAYADFSRRTLIGPMLDRHRNLIVGRTFAKAHGLAALRIGALVAHPETLKRIRRLLPPFSLNICAVRALEAALGERDYLDWYVAESDRSKSLIYDFCRRHGLHFWPSEANFVLIRLGTDATTVTSAIAERGIAIRDRSLSPGCAGCVRITAGVFDHTERALAALEACLATRTR